MSKIFELFGYRLDCDDEEAERSRRRAWCPFMNTECDGGGNRYLSALDIRRNKALEKYFGGTKLVQAGVCSLQLKEGQQPWIVCPRRLLSLRAGAENRYQQYVRKQLVLSSGLNTGKLYRVWSEVKMKVETTTDEDQAKSFDYTFDYIVAGSERKRVAEVSYATGSSEAAVLRCAVANGYTLARRNNENWIDDYPADPILIVEIMTSSTSGGDKSKRTQVAMACEDAILDRENHNGPGINYRQVWARMVSQLIVKSQVGLAWGGRTFWLLQDVLANYISGTTALNLAEYAACHADEVNILAFGYGDLDRAGSRGVHTLERSEFYAGPIAAGGSADKARGFVEIVKIGAPPGKDHLWRSLFRKRPCGRLTG